MVTGPVTSGSGDSTRIQKVAGPGLLNWIRLRSLTKWALASSSAWRNEPGPLSLGLVTVNNSIGPRRVIAMHGENSDVLPLVVVAVAATNGPAIRPGKVREKLARPLSSVVTLMKPRWIAPSPLPEGSHAA